MTSVPPHAQTAEQHYDVVVIGAGIHGLSMANEATSRGLKTLLVQAAKIGGTASCEPSEVVSTLPFLEHFQLPEFFTTVSELQRLHSLAPHLVRLLPTYAVNAPELRSARRVRLGAAVHQRLVAQRFPLAYTPVPSGVDYPRLVDRPVTLGTVNFQRLVLSLAKQAKAAGVELATEHRLVAAQRSKQHWQLELDALHHQRRRRLTGSILINCSGCEIQHVLRDTLHVNTRSVAERVNTGHIFIRAAQRWRHGFALQHANRSWIYVHPFDREIICLGPLLADDGSENAKQQALVEALSLWKQASGQDLRREAVLHERWFTRAQAVDPSSEKTLRYNSVLLDLNNPGGMAPVLNVLGSNAILFHKTARQGLDILANFTTAASRSELPPLPGTLSQSSLDGASIASFVTLRRRYQERFDFLAPAHLNRIIASYGTETPEVLANAPSALALGEHFGHGLFAVEVDFLVNHEQAESAEDVLWRRSYLGLKFNPREIQRLSDYLEK